MPLSPNLHRLTGRARFHHGVVALLIACVALAACAAAPSTAPAPAPSPSAPPTLPAAPQPTGTALPSATPPPATLTPTAPPPVEPRRTQYSIQAQWNYLKHFLAVDETIDYTNSSGSALSEIVIAVEPNAHPGAFRLKELQYAGRPVSNYTLENNQLKLPLPAPLEAARSVRLACSYELYLPVIPPPSNDVRATIFGYSARQTNLVDWYPYIVPYQPGQGWLIHKPWFYGEHQVYEKADFQVEFRLVDPPANLTLAGTSQAEASGNVYRYSHLNARNFTISASQMYQVYVGMAGNITVISYVFPFDAPGGRTALNDAIQAVTLYSRLFGPYPHANLSVVEADFHDGMEYDGLYFLSKGFYGTYDGTPKGYLTMIGVHETAHQWWYARVANDQALEPWLDESLATYSELLYYSSTYPDLSRWWWGYRVDYFQPAGWVNQRIYDYGGSYPYRDGVYLRGARFLDQLRQRIGDQVFLEFIKDYAVSNADTIVTAQTFFDTLKKHSAADISDLQKAYFKP